MKKRTLRNLSFGKDYIAEMTKVDKAYKNANMFMVIALIAFVGCVLVPVIFEWNLSEAEGAVYIAALVMFFLRVFLRIGNSHKNTV